MPVHAFVDESKVRGLVVVAAVVHPRDLTSTRTAMRSLLLPRQSHLHFVKEEAARKGQIADAICGLPVELDIYDASAIKNQKQARDRCLERIVADLASRGAHRLVIEQDDSRLRTDREVLYQAVREHAVQDWLVYEHLPARSEPLLWIPDAAAWCWTKDTRWRERIQSAVRHIVPV